MGRKRLKISDLIKETGITRPTLTSLYYGTGKGINFDTLNRLCGYLSVTPGELFGFYDIDLTDIEVRFDKKEDFSFNGPFITNAGFSGRFIFKDKFPPLGFRGFLTDKKKNHDYSVMLKYDISRQQYLTMFPENVAAYIEGLLFEKIEDLFSDFDSWASVGDSFFLYTSTK